jgi:hypothetical protein
LHDDLAFVHQVIPVACVTLPLHSTMRYTIKLVKQATGFSSDV